MSDAPWEALQRRVEYEGTAALDYLYNVDTEEADDELEAEKPDGARQAGAEVVDERRRGGEDRRARLQERRRGTRRRRDDAANGDEG